MGLQRSRERSPQRRHMLRLVAVIAAVCSGLALAAPAWAHQTTSHLRAHRSARAISHDQPGGSSQGNMPTLNTQDSSTELANLPAVPAKMSCAQLAQTTEVAGRASRSLSSRPPARHPARRSTARSRATSTPASGSRSCCRSAPGASVICRSGVEDCAALRLVEGRPSSSTRR